MNPFIYMFIRKDLSSTQQIIQAAHAVDSLKREGTDTNYMCLFGVDSESELIDVAKYLFDCGIQHEMFFEPDIQSHTAIATMPLRGKVREKLKHFNLLK